MKFKYKNAVINYEVIGKGYPIICLHGMQCDLNLMKLSLEPVFKDYDNIQRIYVDLLGMGHSNAPLEYASSDGILEVISAFIKEIVGEKSFSLIGESYGGYLSFGLLTQFKNQIDQILLVVPAVKPNKTQRILPAKPELDYDYQFLDTLEENMRKVFLNHTVIANEKTYQLYLEQFYSGITLANKEYVFKILKNYPYSFDLDEYFKNNKFTTTLTFIAGKQDIVVGYHDLFEYMKLFKNAFFYLIEKGGHNLQIEQVQEYYYLVNMWLKSLSYKEDV